MALDTDIDDQDQAETFDEEATGGDSDGETSYPLDRSVRDETARKGDADLNGDDDAMDADEESDEALAGMDDEDEEDDLDDDGVDDGPLAVDDIPDFTSDRDFAAEDGEAEVSALAEDDAETISMGDMTAYSADARTSDFESETLSDSDLKDLDYMSDSPKGAEADDAAADESPKTAKAEARHEDKRLDEGLEETFPASDPVSAKHIT